jgi:S1-C subfamily serine protease
LRSACRFALRTFNFSLILSSLLAIQEGSRGVIVLNVKAASLAATAGLKPGDIIEEVNNKPIDNVADLKNAIEYSAWPLRLLVNRYHRSVFILLPKEMLCTAESR